MTTCVLALMLAACTTELRVLDQDNGDCIPLTCSQLGATCGQVPSGCGRMLECGECGAGTCGEVIPNRCEAACSGGDTQILATSVRSDAPVVFERFDGRIIMHTAFHSAASPGRSHLFQLEGCGTPLTQLDDTPSDTFAGSDVVTVDDAGLHVVARRADWVRTYAPDGLMEERALGLDDPCAIASLDGVLYIAQCAVDRSSLLRVGAGGELEMLRAIESPRPRRFFVLGGSLLFGQGERLVRYDPSLETLEDVGVFEGGIICGAVSPEGALYVSDGAEGGGFFRVSDGVERVADAPRGRLVHHLDRFYGQVGLALIEGDHVWGEGDAVVGLNERNVEFHNLASHLNVFARDRCGEVGDR
ncbi:MAG: hypothetical protein AAF184_25670 [Pseudomonadota bacterium]